jgi:formylglycine-generating enzyme required for sulfatase activity
MNRSLLLSLLALALFLVGGCSKEQKAPAPGAGVPGTTTMDPKTGITLAYIPAGTFMMGSPESEAEHWERGDDESQHQVTLSKPFWMGTTEVTNAQYRRFVQATGHREPGYWDNSDYNRPNQPVVGVDWNDAVAYAEWAGMSLPTEAQWEYAARAGTITAWWSGNSESDLARVDWYGGYGGNSDDRLRTVGEKAANAWGLHDVHGNVSEWIADWRGDYPSSSQTDPTGAGSGSDRVVRGGTRSFMASDTRVASRNRSAPENRGYYLGFRVIKKIP